MRRDLVEFVIPSALKIGIVSPSKSTLETVRGMLQGANDSFSFVQAVAGVEHAARLVDQEHPDALFVEGSRHDAQELNALEVITARHPGLAVVILSPNQSPEYLRHAMRAGLREVLSVPVSREALLEAAGRIHARKASGSSRSGSGRTLCLVGCKGGSGTTFLAANLAYAIASSSEARVALIDLNGQLGDASLYVSERAPGANLADVARDISRLDIALLQSSMLQVLPNFHVLAAPDEPEEALQIQSRHIDAVLWTAASHYDFIIVDAGRSLNPLSVRAMDRAETVYAVLQLSLPFVRDAKRLFKAMGALGYGREKIRLVVNRMDKNAALTPGEVASALRHEVAITIPNSYDAVSDSINQGIAINKLAPRDPVSRALLEQAGVLVPARKSSGSWLKNLLPAY